MSAEQFVRYKQQLRDITKKFIDAASMLNDDQLEIVLARLMDRITEDPDKAFQDKYKGLILADILEMRQAGVIVKQNPGWRTKQEIIFRCCKLKCMHGSRGIRAGFDKGIAVCDFDGFFQRAA